MLPSVEEIAANLRTYRENATPEQIRDGREWYPATYVLAADLADEAFDHTGDPITAEFAAGVIAAFSQNSTWIANITMARKYLNGLSGKGGGLKAVLAELDAMENGVSPDVAIGSLKRPDFWRNIIGQHEFVTCDRWHLRAAFALDALDPADGFASRPSYVQRTRVSKTAPWRPCVKLTDAVRDAVTAATAMVAGEYGESPAECQAVIWCAVRGSAV